MCARKCFLVKLLCLWILKLFSSKEENKISSPCIFLLSEKAYNEICKINCMRSDPLAISSRVLLAGGICMQSSPSKLNATKLSTAERTSRSKLESQKSRQKYWVSHLLLHKVSSLLHSNFLHHLIYWISIAWIKYEIIVWQCAFNWQILWCSACTEQLAW